MKNKQPANLAIIDHVGEKAGMDYYSGSLANGIVANGGTVTIYSNFVGPSRDQVQYKPWFEGHSNANVVLKISRFLLAMFRSSLNARLSGVQLVILHVFSTNLLSLCLILVPKLFGLKVAVIAHDIASFADNDNALVQNIIYQHLADKIIVHNQYSKDCLLAHVHFNEPDKLHIIRHGGYLAYIGEPVSRLDARKSLGLEPQRKYLLFFGQIKKVKGLDILLKSMTLIDPDIHLIIAGKPWKAKFDRYQALIEQYQLQSRVKLMIRFITDDERKLLFYASDVNVLPYRVIYQSGVLLMAMSHGLPVIASDLPGNKEIIRNQENGLLFASEDAAELANAIGWFFANPDRQPALSNSAMQTIETEYNWRDIAASYLHLI